MPLWKPSAQPLKRLTLASLLCLPAQERQQFWTGLTAEERAALNYDWTFWARPNQLAPPGDWIVWLLLAGRGFGKTRTGAEWVRAEVESGRRRRLGLIAATAADARDVMVEGESGLLAVCPPWNMPEYEPSKRRLTWPNGTIATLYSADEPNRLRGPQHDGLWLDELAAWSHPETWDMAMFGLRLGENPQCVVTTTPKPTPLVVELAGAKTTALTTGTTYENRANLAQSFYDVILAKYEGTRLGRQELMAEILDAGGQFFDMWRETHHTCVPFDVPRHWRFYGGLDWGKAAPFAFVLAALDDSGHAWIVDEIVEAGLENHQQAQKIKDCLVRHGCKPEEVVLQADPSMFPPSDPARRHGDYNIRDFQRAGLVCVPAINDRVSGWSRLKEYLRDNAGGTPYLRVFTHCHELIKSLPTLLADTRQPEDIAQHPKQYDHVADATRYLFLAQPSPAIAPPSRGLPTLAVEFDADGVGRVVEMPANLDVPWQLLPTPRVKERTE